ncbi:protein-export chaperone SecB [Candidatus Pelagibacter sp.]|nr:protein-export chaperone SecB [Candidatus Pelagibacter sp.]
MMMTKKYEIILKYIRDISIEIPNPETFIFSRDYITKYSLGINISTETLKNGMIETITKLTYKDPTENKKKSHFEISYSTVIKIIDKNLEKKEMEKILLCEVQNEIYPELEKVFINLIKDSGFPELKLEKKVNFEELYQRKMN